MLAVNPMRNFFTSLCDLIYPHNCLLCHQYLPPPWAGQACLSPVLGAADGRQAAPDAAAEILCSRCRLSIEENRPPFCPRCSRHSREGALGHGCGECARKKFHFDWAASVTSYNGTMRHLIHLFKYGQKTSLRHLFNPVITNFIELYLPDIRRFDTIVPIPLHPARLRERGYNQAELLARHIAAHLHIPLSRGNLMRVRNTRFQAAIDSKERWTNLKGAFKINQPCEFLGKSVLVVDDLLTTGATASEAALTLKSAGARQAGILTLCMA